MYNLLYCTMWHTGDGLRLLFVVFSRILLDYSTIDNALFHTAQLRLRVEMSNPTFVELSRSVNV